MAAGKMGISRLTKKSPARHASSITTSSITASQELQDIGGLLSQPSPPPSAHSAHPAHRLPTPVNQPSSPLLRMPPEIRYEIYRYLIPTPAKRFWPIPLALTPTKRPSRTSRPCSTTSPSTTPSKSSSGAGSTPLAILLTNKQLYHEALSVLYSEHLFHFIGPSYRPVLEFIRRLGPDARSQIRQIRLTLLAQEMGGAGGGARGEGDEEEDGGRHGRFCAVIHEACPGLTTLKADPVVWL